jgi:hypothetical protein
LLVSWSISITGLSAETRSAAQIFTSSTFASAEFVIWKPVAPEMRKVEPSDFAPALALRKRSIVISFP